MLAKERQSLNPFPLKDYSDSVQIVEPSEDAEDGQVDTSSRDGLLDDREPIASLNRHQ